MGRLGFKFFLRNPFKYYAYAVDMSTDIKTKIFQK